MVVSDCISLYRVIVSVKRADEHKTAEQVKVKDDKLYHSAELCSYVLYVLTPMFSSVFTLTSQVISML